MARYKFSSYLTMYDVEIVGVKTLKSRSAACFADIFHELKYRTGANHKYIYDIYLCTTAEMVKLHYDNYCPFTIDEVRSHVHRLKKLFPFVYNVSNVKIDCGMEKNVPCYKVHVELEGKIMYHLYMMTWVRYLYEHPYNFYMKEAYRLQKMKQYRFTSIANLFLTVSHLNGGGLGHAASMHGKFISNRKLKERLLVSNNLNSLYKANGRSIEDVIPYIKYLDETDDWTEEHFKESIPVYAKSYKVLYDKKTF